MKHEVNDRIRITYNPKGGKSQRVWVTVIVAVAGGDLVAVDDQGQIYTTWWETDVQRPTGKRGVQKRHWRHYSSGIFGLKRGLVYALIGAKEIKIPTLAELQEFCQGKQVEISLLESDITSCLDSISNQFERLQNFLRGRRRWPLQESSQQLNFFLLLRDSQGRVNLGVLQARLTAIDWRFAQELEHLLGWLPHYAARLEAILELQRQFQRTTAVVRRSLKAMTSHEAFKAGETSPRQITGIQGAIGRQIMALEKLQTIRPFTCWAKYCLDDLHLAHQLITTHQFIEAKTVINRLVEAMKLRLLDFELEELIAEIGLAILLQSPDGSEYSTKITELIEQFKAIDETGFQEPVCQSRVLPSLRRAKAAIKAKQWLEAKKLLKQAVAPI